MGPSLRPIKTACPFFTPQFFFTLQDPTYRLDEGCWDRKDTTNWKIPKLNELALLLLQKRNALKLHVMVNKYEKAAAND